MHFHTSSHVKPHSVKMWMQMRASRKEHKNNGCCHSVGFLLLRWTRIDLRSGSQFKERKRQELSNAKKRCWLVIADFCIQETQWQLYLVQYIYIYIYMYVYFGSISSLIQISLNIKVKLATIVEGDPKAPFSMGVGEGATPFLDYSTLPLIRTL